jgi:tetratricopeptide (TPR) repeat protein
LARDDPQHALDLILEAWSTYNGVSGTRLWPEIFSQFVLIGLAEKALEYVRRIPEGMEFDAAIALCLINTKAMETGALIDHVAVLEEAAAIAAQVSSPPIRADAEGRVAVEFAKRGMLDRAMQEDPDAYAWVNRDRRRKLGHYLAVTGRPDEALDLVGTSFGSDPSDIALAHTLIDALLASGDVDRARSLAESLEPAKERAAACRRIAERLLADGRRDEAAALAVSAFESLVAETGWSFWNQNVLEAAARTVVDTTGPEALIGRVARLWRDATDRDVLAGQLALASPLVVSRPQVAIDIATSFGWVDEFLGSIQP